ncbi:MAG: penicillin-binding protein 1A [Gammaproteobacteria bacterium]|nr:MAG: penicillin-binding protein 1A [Gammaproteobacteria bacterium]
MNFNPFGRLLLSAVFTGFIILSLLAVILYAKIAPELPSIETLRDVQLQVPLRIYTRDGKFLAEFGEKRRKPVEIEKVPPLLIQAFLAAEDDRFYKHSGVDFQGLLRAAIELARTGEKRQGGSTITMQVARNFFLSREKTYLRKLTEIILAFKIERELTKNEVLELYLNKIYLGHRAYGIEAAARVYYGTGIDELSVARMAMIAALPKAPSRVNPIKNPAAAIARRNYILGRMHSLDYIDDAVYRDALAEEDGAKLHMVQPEAHAPFIAEMVRDEMIRRYGPEAYTSGFEVVTTLQSKHQQEASRSLRNALLDYSRRHGYLGPLAKISLAEHDIDAWPELLADYRDAGGLVPGLVIAVEEKSAQVLLRSRKQVTIDWDGLSWARPYESVNRMGSAPQKAADVVSAGDIIRVEERDGGWWLAQEPVVQGALVALRPEDGAVVALVGGFDFSRSKFNRAIQARRQPGSSFKPIIYSAALESGFTAASVINDAPVVFDDDVLEDTWRPENYSGKIFGPTRLREALYRSRNLVSIRILRSIGPDYAAGYAERFGYTSDQLPRDLTLALGSASATPLQMARAYAVFANGGYLVNPYFIKRIQDAEGNVVFNAQVPVVCPDCPETLESIVTGQPQPLGLAPQTITSQNAWLMNSMLQDVIKRGTGKRALSLGRTDLAGKTGTTNDQKDAWFCGYNPTLVATAWVGFDKLEPLGRRETGGHAALPMWMDYMGAVLSGTRNRKYDQPSGLVTVRIDPATGLLAGSGRTGGIFETFRAEYTPRQSGTAAASDSQPGTGVETPEHLF